MLQVELAMKFSSFYVDYAIKKNKKALILKAKKQK